jgi:hypothetical protein
MRSVLFPAIVLALAMPALAGVAPAGELVPGGWLMPPRIPPAPPPVAAEPPIAPPPAPRRAVSRPRTTPPPSRRPVQRTAPSDGRIQF